MNKLQPHVAHVFREHTYDSVTDKDRLLFLNINENISDDTFRLMCYRAGEEKCLITGDKLDLNKNEHNIDKHSDYFGRWLSIEHIQAQSSNENSNYLGNFIPIKGNLNSAIGTKDTSYYLESLGWTDNEMTAYNQRIELFRARLFMEYKEFYKNHILLKYDEDDIINLFERYKYSSFTGEVGTYELMANELQIFNCNAKKEIRHIAQAFDLEVEKLTKAEAFFSLKYSTIKELLEAGMPIVEIAAKYGVRQDPLKEQILNHPVLKELSVVEVNENRVIRVCEDNKEDMLAMYDQHQNVNAILKEYNLVRDHGTVKMFIHMAIQQRASDQELETLREVTNTFVKYNDLLNIVKGVDVEVVNFNKNYAKKEIKIKLKFKEI